LRSHSRAIWVYAARRPNPAIPWGPSETGFVSRRRRPDPRIPQSRPGRGSSRDLIYHGEDDQRGASARRELGTHAAKPRIEFLHLVRSGQRYPRTLSRGLAQLRWRAGEGSPQKTERSKSWQKDDMALRVQPPCKRMEARSGLLRQRVATSGPGRAAFVAERTGFSMLA